jgi:hypothetical protein
MGLQLLTEMIRWTEWLIFRNEILTQETIEMGMCALIAMEVIHEPISEEPFHCNLDVVITHS